MRRASLLMAVMMVPRLALAQPSEPESVPPPNGASAPVATPPPPNGASAPVATPPPPNGASAPVATATPPSGRWEDRIGGTAGAIAIGVGGEQGSVDQEQREDTTSGGLAFVATLFGFGESFSGRGHVALFLGGGSGGPDGTYALDLHLGGGGGPSRGTQFFARLGAEAYGAKNDEIEAGLTLFPTLSLGFAAIGRGIAFEIAPRGGVSGRTEYEPGDESQGRRHWRRLTARLAYGGIATIATDHFAVNGSLVRLADSDPVTVVSGDVCAFFVRILAVCGQAQYWRSIALRADTGVPLDIPFTTFGGSIGIGAAKAGGLFEGKSWIPGG